MMQNRQYIAYLSLGSNMGDREDFLRRAVQAMNDHPQVKVIRESSLYETEPVGFLDQPDFLNNAVAIETTLTPHELLDFVHEIENNFGRVRTNRWGPRVIDIDILIYEGASESTETLELPHPRMPERAFVLAPLAEIAPDLTLPGGISAAQAFDALPDEEKNKVKRL